MHRRVCYWLDGGNIPDVTLVGRGRDGGTIISRHQNGSTTIGTRTGEPSLAIEGRWVVGSSGWHQSRRCCKGAEYFCWIRKIIQIDCTKIGNNT